MRRGPRRCSSRGRPSAVSPADPSGGEESPERVGVTAPEFSEHVDAGALGDVAEDERGHDRIIERPDHGQELRDQVDRRDEPERADVTTRNAKRAEAFRRSQDELEERIAVLAEQENLEAMRPPLDGGAVMEILGLPPGPVVGEALAYLMDERLEHGPIDEERATSMLLAWAAERGLTG